MTKWVSSSLYTLWLRVWGTLQLLVLELSVLQELTAIWTLAILTLDNCILMHFSVKLNYKIKWDKASSNSDSNLMLLSWVALDLTIKWLTMLCHSTLARSAAEREIRTSRESRVIYPQVVEKASRMHSCLRNSLRVAAHLITHRRNNYLEIVSSLMKRQYLPNRPLLCRAITLTRLDLKSH